MNNFKWLLENNQEEKENKTFLFFFFLNVSKGCDKKDAINIHLFFNRWNLFSINLSVYKRTWELAEFSPQEVPESLQVPELLWYTIAFVLAIQIHEECI